MCYIHIYINRAIQIKKKKSVNYLMLKYTKDIWSIFSVFTGIYLSTIDKCQSRKNSKILDVTLCMHILVNAVRTQSMIKTTTFNDEVGSEDPLLFLVLVALKLCKYPRLLDS